MIRLLLYTFYLLIPHIIFGQYQLDSLVHIKNGVKHVRTQQFDAEKRQLETFCYTIAPGDTSIQWKDKAWIQYDVYGNDLVYIESEWDSLSGQWEGKTKRVKQYDEKNRMSVYIVYEMQDSQWMGQAKSTWEYGHQMVSMTEYEGKNKGWVPTDSSVSRFNDNNNEISAIHYHWDSIAGKWAYRAKEENDFLKDNVLKKSVSYIWENDQWKNQEKIVYKYTADSSMVTDRVIYTGSEDKWILRQLTQTAYFDSAKRDEIFAWSEEDDAWVLETLSESYMDRYGRETDFLYKSIKHQVHFQRLTIFDEQGRITLSQEIGFDGNKSAFGTQTAFEFDEEGNLFREVDKVLDVENGAWLVQKEQEFIFDGNIPLRNEGKSFVRDKANLSEVNMGSNKHAVTNILVRQNVEGQPVVTEEIKYYYSNSSPFHIRKN